VADSLDFRVAYFSELGAKVQMTAPDRELLRQLKESSASPRAPTKPTQASEPSSLSPPHASSRDESQHALGEKALCAGRSKLNRRPLFCAFETFEATSRIDDVKRS
jgi:hypothetical protein